MPLEVVKLPEAKQGVPSPPKRRGGEGSCVWMGQLRRVARDYEQLAETRAGLHFNAFAIFMRKCFIGFLV